VSRGERLIKLGDSWFSAKSIEVERFIYSSGVEHSMDEGGILPYRFQGNSEYRRNRVKQSDFERKGPKSRGKQPRLSAKVLKLNLSDKGSDRTVTAKRWAWRQPSLRECVIAQWSSSFNPKMERGLRFNTEATNSKI